MTEMNISKNRNNNINKMIDNKLDEFIDEDQNNYELKVSLLNVDSRFRNKIPKNIIDSESQLLEKNPIYITKDSNEVRLYYKNHNLKVGDQIILKNIKNNEIKLRNSIYLNICFNYFMINLDNHNLQPEYNNNFKLNLVIDDKISNNDRMIGNIPLNSIIGIHNIYILKNENDENISDDIIDNLINKLNISKKELIKNYIFIRLPFNYTNENKLNNNIEFEEFETIKKIIKIEYLNIGCIELNYLNSDYPINNNQFQSLQEISRVDDNNIYFNIGKKALYSENSGGSNVYIGKIINTIEGYPDANNYTIDLKKSFTNIVRMEMITSEIPYIDFNIKNTINKSNNTIHWKYLEDGDYIYSIDINQGNYTPENLISKLQERMNSVERISSTETNRIFNIFNIEFDNNSEEMKFTAFKNNLLPNSLTVEKDISLGT
jgi:7-cyano-7-deazaguanine synthase in queuosine biosynthesis